MWFKVKWSWSSNKHQPSFIGSFTFQNIKTKELTCPHGHGLSEAIAGCWEPAPYRDGEMSSSERLGENDKVREGPAVARNVVNPRINHPQNHLSSPNGRLMASMFTTLLVRRDLWRRFVKYDHLSRWRCEFLSNWMLTGVVHVAPLGFSTYFGESVGRFPYCSP